REKKAKEAKDEEAEGTAAAVALGRMEVEWKARVREEVKREVKEELNRELKAELKGELIREMMKELASL
ncbi:MAG: hypothetical protein Q9196_007474, partial [Gyalolechia fulgens]